MESKGPRGSALSLPRRVRPSRATYQRECRLLLHDLYFKSEAERLEFWWLAERNGVRDGFHGWLLIKLHAGISGRIFPFHYVESLKRQLQRVSD